MNELLQKLSHCVEFGKVDKVSPYPPYKKGSGERVQKKQEELKRG